MLRIAHRIAAVTAMCCISTFFVSTLWVELFGSEPAIQSVKRLIAVPGLFILVPALVATSGSGFAPAASRRGGLIGAKIKRMPIIAANGLLVLVPCAVMLDRWAGAGAFDSTFYLIQACGVARRCCQSGADGPQYA